MSEVHKLEVIIEGSDAKLKQALRDAAQSTKRMTEAINSELGKIKSPTEALKNDKSNKEWRNTVNFLKKSFEDMRNLMIPKELRNSIKNYNKEAQLATGLKVYTDDYLVLKKDADHASDALRKLRAEEEALRDSGASEGLSEPYRKAKKAADEAEKSLDKILKKQRELEESGKAYEDSDRATELYTAEKEAKKKYDTLYSEAKRRMDKKESLSYIKEDGTMATYGDELVKLEASLKKIRAEIRELNHAGKDIQPTAAMRKLTEQADAAVDKLGKCRDTMTELSAKGAMVGTADWIKNQQSIEKYKQQAEAAENVMRRMEASGKDVQFTGGLANQSGLATAEASVKQMITRIKEMNARISETIAKMPVIGRVAANAAYLGSKAFKGMRVIFDQISPTIRKTSGAFASLIQKFKNGAHASNQTNNSFKAGIGTMLKYGLGIRSLYVLFGKLRGAMQDGMRNLAQYSQTTNANLSTLQSGLNQVKNSLATAFVPVLNVVTPILSTLIDYLVAAASAVAQFMAALTGQGTYTVAKRVATDYAAGLNSAGAAADGANESAKELKKTLMGFDQINKLDDDSSSGGSGGSGGGGGAGIGDMFETETVTNQFADFAEKIKQAWTDADFTEIGTIIGTKLKEGLDNIPWDGIKETAEKIGKSVATLINGFVETSGLGTSIGNTVAQALNTGVLGVNAFLTNLHWESVGQFVADSMNGFIATADWAGAGEAVRNGVNGVFRLAATWSGKFDFSAAGEAVKTALNSALSGIKWENAITAASNIGAGIATALNKVMTVDTFSNVGKTAAGVLNTVFSGAYSFIGTVDWKGWGKAIATGINKYFQDFDWKKAGLTFSGAAHGMLTTLKEAVAGTDWKEVGHDIATFIKGIDFKTLLSDVGDLIWAAINASIEAWKSSFNEAPIETTIVTTILGLKFTGLGALFGKKIWNILKGGISSEAGGDDSGTTDSGAGGAFISGVVTWLKNSATSIGLKVGGWSGFLNQVFQTVGGITSPLGVFSDPEIVNYMGNEWNSLIEGLKPYVKEGLDNLNGYIEENPLRILPGYGLLEDGVDFLKKGLESAKDFLKGWKSGISGNDETPEIEAGETDSSGELPLQVVHGKLVVDEIDLPNETDPNRASVSVKATVSEFIIPDAIKKLSGLSAVLTGGISPVTGAVLTGIGAIVSTVSKATGINSLSDIGASILKVWKSGNPVVEGLSGTVSSTTTQQGASLRVTNVAAKVVMADWAEKANTTLKGVMAEIKAKSFSNNGKSVITPIKAKSFNNNGKSVITPIKAKSFNNNGKSVTTPIKAQNINNNGKTVTTTVYANAIRKTSNFAGLALSAVAKIVGGAISLVFKAGGGIYKNGSWRPITAAANGGAFSTGQMFVAREAGPELVGTIGRSTAVMNNNQIVSSVASGVYQAVVAAMAASGGGQKSRPVFNIYVGGRKITDVVIEEVNNRTISTGQCPILT